MWVTSAAAAAGVTRVTPAVVRPAHVLSDQGLSRPKRRAATSPSNAAVTLHSRPARAPTRWTSRSSPASASWSPHCCAAGCFDSTRSAPPSSFPFSTASRRWRRNPRATAPAMTPSTARCALCTLCCMAVVASARCVPPVLCLRLRWAYTACVAAASHGNKNLLRACPSPLQSTVRAFLSWYTTACTAHGLWHLRGLRLCC